MKICKKCGEQVKPNTYVVGYYCYNCGNLGYNDVYSEIDIYNELKEYKSLGYSPKELKQKLENTDKEVVELSEKDISKEPISDNSYSYTKFLCPICQGRVGDNNDGDIAGYNYCPNCGQQIDWGWVK